MPDAAGNKKMLFTRTKHHAFAVHLNRPGGEGTRVTPKKSEWANRRNMARAAWLQIKKKPGARIGSGPCLKTNPNFNTNAPSFEVRGCKVILGGAFYAEGGANKLLQIIGRTIKLHFIIFVIFL